MRTEVNQDADGKVLSVTVYLSRRNIEALAAKLDEPQSACTLTGPNMYVTTFVIAEEDALHYEHPSRGEAVGEAGRMSPVTETVIAGKGDTEYGLTLR